MGTKKSKTTKKTPRRVKKAKAFEPAPWNLASVGKPSEPVKEKTLTEQILNERNLVVAPLEPVSDAPVYAETELGSIRIEGEVTPAKLEAAKQFHKIFEASVDEIMGLAAITPNPQTMAFLERSKLTQEQVDQLKAGKPWSVFQINGQGVMKTPDDKIETVQAYVYRLEQAVINVQRVKNAEIDRLTKIRQEDAIKIRELEDKAFQAKFALDMLKTKYEFRTEQLPLKNRMALRWYALRDKLGTLLKSVFKSME